MNSAEFTVYGAEALFTDILTRTSGDKCSYPIPTYEAIKGITQSIYWKPTFIWYIDSVRVMRPIRMVSKGVRTLSYHDGTPDLHYYTYLADVRYQVRAHFEWNPNRPELARDRIAGKHLDILRRALEAGGRRDIFLGTRECMGYVEPCRFGEGEGFYDNVESMTFGDIMYHGITYPDEALCEEDKGKMTKRFWHPVMHKGVIEFVRPQDCTVKEAVHEMGMKVFGQDMTGRDTP